MGDYDFGIERTIILALAVIMVAAAIAFAGDFYRSLPEFARAVAEVLAVFRGLDA